MSASECLCVPLSASSTATWQVGLESSAVSAGNSYASSMLAAQYSLEGYVDDLMSGLPQYGTIKEALAVAETDWPSLRSRLERMRAALLTSDGAIINLSADAASLPTATALVTSLISRLPPTAEAAARQPWGRPEGLLLPTRTGLQIGTQVNYVAKGCPIYAPGEIVKGAASVITRFLRTAYLWDAVRVQGGAYGCSLGFGRTSGLAIYSSYRDPNVVDTLAAYDGTAAFLREKPIGPAELSKAIIGAIGDLDSPSSVDSKGYTSMLRYDGLRRSATECDGEPRSASECL